MTALQWLTLVDIADCGDGTVAPYQIERPVQTFRVLAQVGYLMHIGGSGQHSTWRITESGRRALAMESGTVAKLEARIATLEEVLKAVQDFVDDDRPVVNAADEADRYAEIQLLVDAALHPKAKA